MPRQSRAHPSRDRRRAGALALALLASCSSIPPGEEHAQPVRGPLPLRTNGPLLQEYLAFRPRRPVTAPPRENELRFVNTYSNIFEDGTGPKGSVTLDGELLRSSVILRRGVAERTDIELELAAMFGTSGFLDVFIENWHDALGFANSGREDRPQFAYDMTVSAGGETVYDLEGDEVGFCDLPLTLTHALLEPRPGRIGLALQAAVEFPTGSESGGYGNGELDWGVALASEYELGAWVLGAGVSYVGRGRASAFEEAGLEVDDPLQGWLSTEWRCARTLSLVAVLRYEQSVSDDLGIEELSGEVLELDLGLVRDLPGGARLWLGFGEDLIAASGPDITLFLGVTTSF
jgi:hypothetical protein